MSTVGAYEAKTRLADLIRAAERGETVTITRHGKPVAQLGPVQDQRHGEPVPQPGTVQDQKRAEVLEVIERMKRARAQRPKVTVAEILAARDEGRRP